MESEISHWNAIFHEELAEDKWVFLILNPAFRKEIAAIQLHTYTNLSP